MKTMKRFAMLFLAALLLAGMVLPMGAAATGKVTYKGQADKFVFSPDNGENPENLFPEFQNVMPGDELVQTIELHNGAINKVYIKAYLRSKGATQDASDLLNQLQMTVVLKNGTKVLYEGPADETGTLADWAYLGKLESGGKVQLEVTLKVPETLGNEFADKAGELQWEFRVDEYPVSSGSGSGSSSGSGSPQTGDAVNLWLWLCLFLGSLVLLVLLILFRRRKHQDE